jgi:hypothetical protein
MTKLQTVANDPLVPWQWLHRQACWGVAAGSGTGSQVSLHFGRKLRRARELNNPTLAPDLRLYQGEVILFIECKWSLESQRKRLFDSEKHQGLDARMVEELQRLVGAVVDQISLSLPPRTLSVQFNNGIHLNVEAVKQQGEDLHDNYSLLVPDRSYIIGPDLRLQIQPRRGILETIGLDPSAVGTTARPPQRPRRSAG